MVEMCHEPICMVSLDFKNAFDNIAHDYLFRVLDRFGFGPTLTGNIRKLYANAESRLQTNGLTPPVSVDGSIRQGYPLSTILFSLFQSPLLWSINAALQAAPQRDMTTYLLRWHM
jgi:hypothetical protein